MKRNGVLIKKAVSLILSATVCAGLAAPALAKGSYDDMDYITEHVKLSVPQKLAITRPGDDITVSASAYFITGNSDPDSGLTLNGEEVETRGARGSFGVYVALESGVNTFSFKNGSSSARVNIRQGTGDSVSLITDIRGMTPDFDCATFSGESMTLSCVAPSGGTVTAEVGGRSVKLKQAAATSTDGVPATYSAKIAAPDVNGTKELGVVTYTLKFDGKTSHAKSAGSVFVTEEDGTLAVQVKNEAANIYDNESRSAFVAVAKLGAVDNVVKVGGSSYQLATGGWIPKDSVQPLTKTPTLKNKISSAEIERRGSGEYFHLEGTSNPMLRTSFGSDKLHVRLLRTTMANSAQASLEDGIGASKLFSSVDISEKDGYTDLIFNIKETAAPWGYDISYDSGTTVIYAKYAPVLSGGAGSLRGLVIAVDPGHGGTDPGAVGVAGEKAAVEKQINLDTAFAVKKRLESLGAKVILCRTDDSDVSMNDRMRLTRENDCDLFISLHCNSVGYYSDTSKIGGVEAFYYEDSSKKLASTMSSYVSSYTGRSNRGAKFSNFRVTLSTAAPAVLVEMGFLTNPVEYDNMTSKNGVYKVANAVGDGVLAMFNQ